MTEELLKSELNTKEHRLHPLSDVYFPALDHSTDLAYAEIVLLWAVCNYGKQAVRFELKALNGANMFTIGSGLFYVMLHYNAQSFVSNSCGPKLRELTGWRSPETPEDEILEHPAKYAFDVSSDFHLPDSYFTIEPGGYYLQLALFYHALITENMNIQSASEVVNQHRARNIEVPAEVYNMLKMAVTNRRIAVMNIVNLQQTRRLN